MWVILRFIYIRKFCFFFLNYSSLQYRFCQKHIWPADLKVIYSRLNNLKENFGFPPYARPFIYQQVIDNDGKQAVSKYEYNGMGVVPEYKHTAVLSNSFRGNNLLKWFSNWGEKWQLLPSSDALVFVDNHDIQRATSYQPLNYKSAKQYKVRQTISFESFSNILNLEAYI